MSRGWSHILPLKISAKFIYNFFSYPVDRQTNKGKKHNLLSRGNKSNIAVASATVVSPYLSADLFVSGVA